MNTSPRVIDAVLLIVDISGYTRFVQQRPVSLEHAEAIVTELMETIIDRAAAPLVVNKLEGDAALLYVACHGERRAAVGVALSQLASFFEVFAASLGRIRAARRHCACDACANVESLQLKAFVHTGEIVIKQVRQFEEIAGEAVIRVHRMTKNSLPVHEYVLMTQAVLAAGGEAVPTALPQTETIDGETVTLFWCEARALAAPAAQTCQAPRASTPAMQRVRTFHNLPKLEAPATTKGWRTRWRAWLAGADR